MNYVTNDTGFMPDYLPQTSLNHIGFQVLTPDQNFPVVPPPSAIRKTQFSRISRVSQLESI
jgi:hypothetical protein